MAQKPPHLSLMGADQLGERKVIAARRRPDQIRVRFFHYWFRRCRLRSIGTDETSDLPDLFIQSPSSNWNRKAHPLIRIAWLAADSFI
jgi:hypothetical protein